jgi:hypothetical protein
MADLPPAGDPPELERRRLALEERRQALEESWPKKWGAVTLGAAATIVAALATGGLGYLQHASDNHRADAEARAQAQVANINAANEQAQKRLENDRAAVAMYFQYLAGEQSNADPALQEKLNLVAHVASDPSLLAPFLTAKVTAGSAAGALPSDVLRGSPNLIAPQSTYHFGDFVAYIQYARDSATAQVAAQKLEAAAASLGFNTPGLQRVGEVPNENEIRIYKPEHGPMAAALAQQLAAKGAGRYCVRPLANPASLPNGVVELWIGKADAPAAGAPC